MCAPRLGCRPSASPDSPGKAALAQTLKKQVILVVAVRPPFRIIHFTRTRRRPTHHTKTVLTHRVAAVHCGPISHSCARPFDASPIRANRHVVSRNSRCAPLVKLFLTPVQPVAVMPIDATIADGTIRRKPSTRSARRNRLLSIHQTRVLSCQPHIVVPPISLRHYLCSVRVQQVIFAFQRLLSCTITSLWSSIISLMTHVCIETCIYKCV